jgi:DmsE family decaheme c-type cytochrome
VGDEVCLSCHEALSEGMTAHYEKTIHAKALNEKNALEPWMKNGCEACHGPGQAHVEGGGGKGVGGLRTFASDDPAEKDDDDAACLKCHKGGHQLYWEGSAHDSRDVSCTSCHTVMKSLSPRHQLSRANVTKTCATCHKVQTARQYRNAHMPVREGKMDCTSCHNPHGTIGDSLIAANTINENCYQCHADKRGPFLWEHAPVNENCLNCHDPHGTTRSKMLKVGEPRLCQSCHIFSRHPSQPFDKTSNRVIGNSCMNCHPKVHGSNHPSGNRFTR